MNIPLPLEGAYVNAATGEEVRVSAGKINIELKACESMIFKKQ